MWKAKGRKLGTYRVYSLLGRGASGLVCRGKDTATRRPVAIKLLTAGTAALEQREAAVARLLKEVEAIRRLDHPNIVALYDHCLMPAADDEDTLGYIVMELVPGRSLARHFKLKDRVGTDFALQVIAGVLAGLDHAHSRGIIHRDIKPGNILLGVTGKVKLTDFGIARIEATTVDEDGMPFGTPCYVAPEQLQGQPAERRSDLFAAGAVFYECLTGERAFPGHYTATIVRRILNDQPIEPSVRNREVPAALDAVLARALAKKPADRFASAAAFVEAIRTAVGERRWNTAAMAANDTSGVINPLWHASLATPDFDPEQPIDEEAEPSTAPLQRLIERVARAPAPKPAAKPPAPPIAAASPEPPIAAASPLPAQVSAPPARKAGLRVGALIILVAGVLAASTATLFRAHPPVQPPPLIQPTPPPISVAVGEPVLPPPPPSPVVEPAAPVPESPAPAPVPAPTPVPASAPIAPPVVIEPPPPPPPPPPPAPVVPVPVVSEEFDDSAPQPGRKPELPGTPPPPEPAPIKPVPPVLAVKTPAEVSAELDEPPFMPLRKPVFLTPVPSLAEPEPPPAKVKPPPAKIEPPSPTPTPVMIKPEPPRVTEGDRGKEFASALALFRQSNLSAAATAFEAYAATWPEDAEASTALYRLGEARMTLGETERARDSFRRLTERYSASTQAAPALVMLGIAENRLGRRDAACTAFDRARSTTLPTWAAQRLAAERRAAGCPDAAPREGTPP